MNYDEQDDDLKPKKKAPRTAWAPGVSGNPAGRPKGTKNRTTEEMRKLIQQVISGQLQNFDTDLDKMNDFNRWVVIDKLIKYFMPSLTKTEIEGELNTEMKITVEYEDTKKEDSHD